MKRHANGINTVKENKTTCYVLLFMQSAEGKYGTKY